MSAKQQGASAGWGGQGLHCKEARGPRAGEGGPGVGCRSGCVRAYALCSCGVPLSPPAPTPGPVPSSQVLLSFEASRAAGGQSAVGSTYTASGSCGCSQPPHPQLLLLRCLGCLRTFVPGLQRLLRLGQFPAQQRAECCLEKCKESDFSLCKMSRIHKGGEKSMMNHSAAAASSSDGSVSRWPAVAPRLF